MDLGPRCHPVFVPGRRLHPTGSNGEPRPRPMVVGGHLQLELLARVERVEDGDEDDAGEDQAGELGEEAVPGCVADSLKECDGGRERRRSEGQELEAREHGSGLVSSIARE